MLASICIGAIAAASYLLMAGQISADEGAAAVLCGIGIALWCRALLRTSSGRFSFEWDAVPACLRAVAGLPSATAKVGAALARSLLFEVHGETTRLPFIHGARSDPKDAARRGIVVLAKSLAPDSYVLRTPEGHGEIDIHSIVDTPPRDDPRWPI